MHTRTHIVFGENFMCFHLNSVTLLYRERESNLQNFVVLKSKGIKPN